MIEDLPQPFAPTKMLTSERGISTLLILWRIQVRGATKMNPVMGG
jgi:hypothetical protein